MRTLEYYPVDTVFFYVPQIVQALRHDDLGYVERYIMEAGAVSQLFAHQIIWNMKANFFIDADKECLRVKQRYGFRLICILLLTFIG
jgi:phosphatidylinositol 4-kinase